VKKTNELAKMGLRLNLPLRRSREGSESRVRRRIRLRGRCAPKRGRLASLLAVVLSAAAAAAAAAMAMAVRSIMLRRR
jgi:hypothetical protein